MQSDQFARPSDSIPMSSGGLQHLPSPSPTLSPGMVPVDARQGIRPLRQSSGGIGEQQRRHQHRILHTDRGTETMMDPRLRGCQMPLDMAGLGLQEQQMGSDQ